MISRDGTIEFGNHTSFNSNCMVSSNTSIKFGDFFCAGWNVSVIDWDGHDVLDCCTDIPTNSAQPVFLGKGCWLSAYSTVLKGVRLADEVIVPYGTIVTKSCGETCCVFGGMPNRIIKSGVYRKDSTKKRNMSDE